MSKKLLTHPEIEIRELKAPYSIEKWAFIPLYALTFCEIFVNFKKWLYPDIKKSALEVIRSLN